MKTRVAAAFCFALLLFAAASAQTDRVRELAPGVYFWQGDGEQRQPANCTWVIFKDYVLVIDANFPWGAREILPRIKATTNKPIRFVFDTHYHSDHTFGNSLFVDAGATIICSEACAGELRTKGAAGWNNWKDAAHPLTGLRLEQASITFTDGMVLDDGTQRVEISKMGPGHSKGDSVAYLPKQKILVTGDLCVTWSAGNNVADADADHENWVRALDRLSEWDVNTVIPGHGTPATRPALKAQREYLADMLNQVRTGRRAGKSADALAREIDLSRHGSLAANAAANASSIRAMYKHLGG
jgi:glyoxylase-like metal-dependent hydrolase (beta-lactamase superfamily II)